MFQVMYEIDGQKFVMSFMDAKSANNFVVALRNSGICNIYASSSGESKTVKKHFIVKVSFGSGKLYTYLSKTKVEAGAMVVVWTTDGPTVVSVVESGEMTESELVKICPMNQFKYIKGKVVAA